MDKPVDVSIRVGGQAKLSNNFFFRRLILMGTDIVSRTTEWY